jgi:hypothetical protein
LWISSNPTNRFSFGLVRTTHTALLCEVRDSEWVWMLRS